MAKLRTLEALQTLLEYFEAALPAEVATGGVTSRLRAYRLGIHDPMALTDYDALLLATVPDRLGVLGDELTMSVPVDVTFAVLGATEDEAIARQIAYGDALVNLAVADRTFGGAVFGSTVHSPEILMPSPGKKQVGLTIVRLHIELNLLGG